MIDFHNPISSQQFRLRAVHFLCQNHRRLPLPSKRGSWRNPSTDRIFGEMAVIIKDTLEEFLDSGDSDISWPAPSLEELREVSKFIDAGLYAAAPSIQSYWDVEDIDNRVEGFLYIYVNRFADKDFRRHISQWDIVSRRLNDHSDGPDVIPP